MLCREKVIGKSNKQNKIFRKMFCRFQIINVFLQVFGTGNVFNRSIY